MKICIVTVYNSENCGSILQAYALGKKLTNMGHSVQYLYRETKSTGASTIKVGLVILKSLLKGNVKNAQLKWKFHKQCLEDEKLFSTVKIKDVDDIQVFILGSDTIWQLSNQYFSNRFDRYWGVEFKNHKVVSYAPSINDAGPELFVSNSKVHDALENLQAISVRDSYTKDVLEKCINKQIYLVCDPTMLLDVDEYSDFQRVCPIKGKFILIYAFRDFCSGEDIEAIRIYAKRNKYQIISFGVARKWCDLSVPFDAFAMPSYFKEASCIITNTFHGNVFSIIYSKRFVNFSRSNKVVGLLQQFSLSERTIRETGKIEDIMDAWIDYMRIAEVIKSLRQQSVLFLEKVLSEGGDDE